MKPWTTLVLGWTTGHEALDHPHFLLGLALFEPWTTPDR
jgi:hypothetical protein